MKNSILSFEKFLSEYKTKGKYSEFAKKWFPLYPSKELAGLAAALMTDGHIDWNDYDGTPRPKKLLLYSNHKNECQWFLDLVWQLFQVRGKIVRYKPTSGFSSNYSYKAIVYCAQLARLLIQIGVPCGDKTLKSYLVPPWIVHGNRDIKRAFLKILFNFDGSLSLRKRGNASFEMNYCSNKHELYLRTAKEYFNQIRSLLLDFGVHSGKIHVRPVGKEKFMHMLFISDSLSIMHFHNKIGFLNEVKTKKLEFAVNRISIYKRLKGLSYILEELRKKTGSDKEAVAQINLLSKVKYTYRQFEHMRRDEANIPIDLINSALIILGKKKVSPLKLIHSGSLVVAVLQETFG
jgi:hypothetical protein